MPLAGPITPLCLSHASAPQMLKYGLDDDQHCIWWPLMDQTCMPGTYITHPDYRELVCRLPEGTGQPGPDNTVRLATLQHGQGKGIDDAARAGTAEEQAPSLAVVAEAAAQKRSPHILFLDAIPDLTPGTWPEGEADQVWKQWVSNCSWTRL